MTIPNLPVVRPVKAAWNKGRIIGQKKPLLPKHVWAIRVRLELAHEYRDLALFRCDLVCLKVADVFAAGEVKDRASVVQSKTGHPVQFEITETTRASLDDWIKHPGMVGCPYLFPSRFHDSSHRIVRDWVSSIGLEPSAYGTHSMRRTKAAQIYKKTGNLRAVQLLLGHVKMDTTVRYLGVELEDALEISEAIEI